MSDYQTYPMWLHHPHFQAAVISDDQTLRRPIRFPPVLVHDDEQRADHEAKGYKPGGTPNPRAFEAQVLHGPAKAYVHQEYPKWVGDKLVQSEEQELALMENVA